MGSKIQVLRNLVKNFLSDLFSLKYLKDVIIILFVVKDWG